MNQSTMEKDQIYQLNGKIPLAKAIPFGLQHILAMFIANIAPVFIVAGACGMQDAQIAGLIQNAMIIAGIGTMIQLYPIWKIGSGLPIVMGISFTFVSVFCFIGPTYGYETIVGAVLIGGILEGILGLFAKYWIRLISPIVAATVVTAIGFSLLSVGASSFGGGSGNEKFGSVENWIMGTVALVCCLGFQLLVKSYWKQLSALFGLLVGYLTAIGMGCVDFSSLKSAKLFALPQIMPFSMEFHPSAILAVLVIFLVSATETIGDTSALAATGLNREVTAKEISGSIVCDGWISALSSIFGCMPITSFSQNVGLVSMTKVVNRFAIFTGAVIMVLAGFCPIFGALLATMPDAVLGGCTIFMFGSIVLCGMQMIAKCGFTQRNITIAGLALSIGLGFTQVQGLFLEFPKMVQTVFGENCVAIVFVIAIILNLVLPKEAEEKMEEGAC